MLKKLSSLTQVALLVLTVVYIPGYTASGRESSLPSCDNARQNYDAGKLYEALGVDSKASAKEIRRAFKKMSVQCHPDKDRDNKNAEDNFIAITGAYETLSNDEERAKYDASRASGWKQGKKSSAEQRHGSSHQQYQQWKPKDYQDINVNDVFGKFFQQQSQHRHSHDPNQKHTHYTFTSSSQQADNFDDLDKMFENIFSGFHFKRSRGSSNQGSTNHGQRRGQKVGHKDSSEAHRNSRGTIRNNMFVSGRIFIMPSGVFPIGDIFGSARYLPFADLFAHGTAQDHSFSSQKRKSQGRKSSNRHATQQQQKLRTQTSTRPKGTSKFSSSNVPPPNRREHEKYKWRQSRMPKSSTIQGKLQRRRKTGKRIEYS
eukprot:gene2298-5287_t